MAEVTMDVPLPDRDLDDRPGDLSNHSQSIINKHIN